MHVHTQHCAFHMHTRRFSFLPNKDMVSKIQQVLIKHGDSCGIIPLFVFFCCWVNTIIIIIFFLRISSRHAYWQTFFVDYTFASRYDLQPNMLATYFINLHCKWVDAQTVAYKSVQDECCSISRITSGKYHWMNLLDAVLDFITIAAENRRQCFSQAGI